jgi:predicted nucleotidyltransferase
VLEIADRHGATNLRVFGSVARGDEDADSDIDVLVDLPPDAGLFTLLRLKDDLERVLETRVDVIPADSLRPEVRARVVEDVVAL